MISSRSFITAALAVLAAAPVAAQSLRGSETQPAMLGFANTLAIGDGEIIAGEPQNAMTPGAVYVFRQNDGGMWTEVAMLTAADGAANDGFGAAMSVDGNRMIIGANNAGLAYVFERSGGEWSQAARLKAAASTDGDGFGQQVAIDGNVALVGAFGTDDNTGAVYVFHRDDSGEWAEAGMLAPADSLEAGGRYGVTLALSAPYAMVAATRADNAKGKVYVFRWDDSSMSWAEDGVIAPSDLENGNRFGSAIELVGDKAMISSPRRNNFIGAVYTFARNDEGEWSEGATLVPFDGTRQNRFGTDLAFDGGFAWIGAPGSNGFQGVVYRYEIDMASLTWIGAEKIATSDLQRGDFFAGIVAAHNGLAAVGIPGDDYGAGTAAVFQLTDAGWVDGGKIMNEQKGMEPITGGEVKCEDGVASLFDCAEVDMVAFLPVQAVGGGRGVRVNDVWGWTDPETNREYALIGRTDGTSFIDVTDAGNPVYLGNLPLHDGARGSTWRDVKVYQNHAFIVSDGAGAHGMQVFDLTRLRGLTAPQTFDETAHYDRINSAHNIVINEETGFAYSVGSSAGGETCGGGLHMINIQNPAQPTFAGCFADPETGRSGTGYSHDAQCIIYHGPDSEHAGKEICLGSNETALSIADVSDKDNPIALSRASYPNVGYAHQGWVSEDHRYFYLGDELDELSGNLEENKTRTLIWDISDLDDPVMVKEFWGTTAASDHNMYVRGNLLYQSNYVAGLRVLDISDPENPSEVGYFDTVPYGDNSAGFNGSWSNYPYFASGTIVVSSGREGVFFLKRKEQPVP